MNERLSCLCHMKHLDLTKTSSFLLFFFFTDALGWRAARLDHSNKRTHTQTHTGVKP
jgi:hypothetical protein